MSQCGEPCDGCPNRAEHHLCDACCHDEVNAIQAENRELRALLAQARAWMLADTKMNKGAAEKILALSGEIVRVLGEES